jgi:hypothetical protein
LEVKEEEEKVESETGSARSLTLYTKLHKMEEGTRGRDISLLYLNITSCNSNHPSTLAGAAHNNLGIAMPVVRKDAT